MPRRINPANRLLFRGPGHFLALGGGAGLSPVAPGTAGSLAALPFLWLFAHLGAWAHAAIVATAFAAGIFICGRAAESLGALGASGKSGEAGKGGRGKNNDTPGNGDHPAIVWDEIVGMWVALCFIPLSWSAVAAGFVLFRLFDIAKPWPINRLERIRGGAGIMLDDLAAGLLANLALRLLLPYLPP